MGRAEIMQVSSRECVMCEWLRAVWVGCPVSQKMSQLIGAGFTVIHLLRKVYRIRTSRNSDSCTTVAPVGTVSVRGHCCLFRWDPEDQSKVCLQSTDRYNLQLAAGTGTEPGKKARTQMTLYGQYRCTGLVLLRCLCDLVR